MKKYRLMSLILGVLALPIMAFAGPSGTLKIFHAGSLTVPFAAIEKAFEAKYPGVDVLREAGGSTKMARLISEVGKEADIMASADYKVIDNNLIPKFADWNIRFATNQLVLCYTDKSRDAERVDAERGGAQLGRIGEKYVFTEIEPSNRNSYNRDRRKGR